eukprot:TRINITY_DN20980_c1_g3_i1.p1 TRINITY_DN20980_c1_g3~~TRINITY_DN20980_c1_g3_i1.p1  ORF type:complete len:311 (-),score=50.64 TRINITY_DN20980_c1_g3_i1:3-839(-)
MSRTEGEGVPGGFVIHNILSPSECDEMIRFSETCGWTEDAPVSLGRHIRKNENCVWIADDSLNDAIFDRCRDFLPKEVDGGEVCGLNARWRLYKYNPQDIFHPHSDGSWPGSGLNANGRLVCDKFGDRWSQLTIVIYLNDEFEGGPTRFFLGLSQSSKMAVCLSVPILAAALASLMSFFWSLLILVATAPVIPAVARAALAAATKAAGAAEMKAPRGGAVCFFHGDHPLSPLHEGGLVTRGTKYIIRSDVLYKLPANGKASLQDGWRLKHYAKFTSGS